MAFPEGFQWGVATASYQVEGAPRLQTGGGASVWDMFCRRPGVIDDSSNGDTACDTFHLYEEDARLMKELGVPNYRLSLSWPRILPEGTGRVSEEGLAYYDRLLDTLLENGVQPHVTLYHWDTPYELYLRGGWLNRDIAGWFGEYTELVAERLGDRVASWMTLNEPQCFIGLGMGTGEHAPGDKMGDRELLVAVHHALLAHGTAVQALRAQNAETPIGWAPVGVCSIPATDSPEDVEAARRSTVEMDGWNLWNSALYSDPVFLGRYPDAVEKLWDDSFYRRGEGDMALVHQPLDFYGANIYHASTVRAGEDGEIVRVPEPVGIGRSAYQWPITPDALYWGPKFFYERYGKPIVITENGMANADWVAEDGEVHDGQRIDYYRRYIAAFRRAGEDGVELKGYFAWTLMDNFEWSKGYTMRFGLVHVDFETQKRTPKASAHWYKGVIASNGENLA